jgi:inositol-phosphate transport system substrate-binding protein
MGKRTVEGRTEADDVYRLSRRHFLIGTGALIAATACSTATQPATQNLPEGTVKLTAWTIGPDAPSYYRRDNLIAAGETLGKAVSAQNPKTSIQVDATFESGGQWGDYLQKFTLAAEAKSSPDIILAGHENLAPWVGPGYVIPLDDLIKKYQNEGDIKDVIPTLWNAMKLKGKTYGVPQDTEARPMYYRKDLLAKMGWSKDKIDGLPDAVKKGEFAWPDFVATAKEAISKGIVGPGMGWYTRTSKGADVYMFYYQNGGEMQDSATGKLVIVKDALQKHFQVHGDAVRNDKILTQAIYGMDGKIFDQTVMDGKVLFFNAGTWKWKDWQTTFKVPEQSLVDNVGYMLIPAAQRGGKPVTVSHPLAYAVTANAKDPDLAFRLIANATTPELNSKHSVTSAHLAVLTTQKDDPTYKTDKFLLATGYMLEYTKFIPNHAKFGVYDDVLYRFLGAVKELQGQLGDDLIVK